MEAITKKRISIEFEGAEYLLPDDSTVEDLLVRLGLPRDTPVRLQSRNGGFVLARNNP